MNQLTFEDAGRTYTCEAASSRATPETVWWWVSVSGDGQRYAAFHKAKGDTASSVKAKIIAYYEKVLADRARPPEPRATWLQRRNDAKAQAEQKPAS
jgi:hypothetical protein